MELLILISAFLFPVFTLGCVLVHFNMPFAGTIIIIYALLKNNDLK